MSQNRDDDYENFLADRIDWIMYAVGDCYKALIHMGQLDPEAFEEIVQKHNDAVAKLRALDDSSPRGDSREGTR